jgi:hypothetical protein
LGTEHGRARDEQRENDWSEHEKVLGEVTPIYLLSASSVLRDSNLILSASPRELYGVILKQASRYYFFGVTAESVLRLVAGLLAKHRLDAVLIGNAAAALQGSPVTTVDLDFLFRKTPGNLRKVRRLADDLDAVVFLPYYPASELYRVVRDRDGLQLDFMAKIDGIRSFEGLRARATATRFGKHELLVAALEDIIRSKQAANRPQDRAVLPVLRRTLREAR